MEIIATSNFSSCDVLRLLNANRENNYDEEYFSWRYYGESSPYKPVVFYAIKNAEIIGMSGIVFRKYVIDGKPSFFGITGDTAINGVHRRNGYGTQLLKFMLEYVKDNKLPPLMAIANASFCAAAIKAGWKTNVGYSTYVFVIQEPNEKKRTKVLFKIFKWYCDFRKKLTNYASFKAVETTIFSEKFQYIWENLNKTGIVVREKSIEILKWRFIKNSGIQYRFTAIEKNNVTGWFVWYLDTQHNLCYIADFLCADIDMVKPNFCAFIDYIRTTTNAAIVRMNYSSFNLNFGQQLQSIGFIKRPDDGFVCSTCALSDYSQYQLSWLITPGDKDL